LVAPRRARPTVSFVGAKERLFSRAVRLIVVVALALGALAACDAPRAPRPKLWTLFDVQALYADGAGGEDGIALDGGLPGGVKLEKMLSPADATTVVARPTITEGYNGSYFTTEVWSHFDEVWLQPMYIPVKAWANGVPQPLAPGTWIFSVGPRSGFYSPFWQMVYFDVDENTPTDAITSVRQVLDGKYPLHFGPGRTVSLVPGDVVGPPGDMPTIPFTTGSGWLDGQRVSFIDFGKATFTWNEQAVIDELPIYVLLFRTPDGRLVAPDIQTVAGTGPPGSGGPPAPIIDKELRYAAYWRIYTVTVPASARVFSPDPYLQQKLSDAGLSGDMIIDDYSADGLAYANQLSGWVAINPDPASGMAGCFATGGGLDPDPSNTNSSKCIWLNSQAAIEMHIDPSAIRRTDVTVTCPFVTIDGRPVSPIK